MNKISSRKSCILSREPRTKENRGELYRGTGEELSLGGNYIEVQGRNSVWGELYKGTGEDFSLGGNYLEVKRRNAIWRGTI